MTTIAASDLVGDLYTGKDVVQDSWVTIALRHEADINGDKIVSADEAATMIRDNSTDGDTSLDNQEQMTVLDAFEFKSNSRFVSDTATLSYNATLIANARRDLNITSEFGLGTSARPGFVATDVRSDQVTYVLPEGYEHRRNLALRTIGEGLNLEEAGISAMIGLIASLALSAIALPAGILALMGVLAAYGVKLTYDQAESIMTMLATVMRNEGGVYSTDSSVIAAAQKEIPNAQGILNTSAAIVAGAAATPYGGGLTTRAKTSPLTNGAVDDVAIVAENMATAGEASTAIVPNTVTPLLRTQATNLLPHLNAGSTPPSVRQAVLDLIANPNVTRTVARLNTGGTVVDNSYIARQLESCATAMVEAPEASLASEVPALLTEARFWAAAAYARGMDAGQMLRLYGLSEADALSITSVLSTDIGLASASTKPGPATQAVHIINPADYPLDASEVYTATCQLNHARFHMRAVERLKFNRESTLLQALDKYDGKATGELITELQMLCADDTPAHEYYIEILTTLLNERGINAQAIAHAEGWPAHYIKQAFFTTPQPYRPPVSNALPGGPSITIPVGE